MKSGEVYWTQVFQAVHSRNNNTDYLTYFSLAEWDMGTDIQNTCI